jgi:hypothetical protein
VALRMPRTPLRPGYSVELRREVRTGPVTGYPRGSRGRVVGDGERPGEHIVELIGTGNVVQAFSIAGSGQRVSVPRDALRRVYPPSRPWLRPFD